MGKKRKAKESGTKYWKCLQCGKDGQDISRGTCEECGRDLNIYGEAYETGGSPSPTPLPRKKIKKICIAVAAVIAVVVLIFAALMFFGNKPYEPTVTTTTATESTTMPTTAETTEAPTTTEASTTAPPSSSTTVFPDFLNFANGYASQDSYEYTEETGLKHIYYLVNEDAVMTVFDEYVELISTEYSYELINEDEYYDWYGFEFVGTGVVGKFYTEFPSGAKYHNNSVSLQFHDYTNGNYELELTISELIDIVKTDKRTTYGKVDTAEIPDFEIFANGLAPEIKSETNSNDNFISVYFELKDDEVLQDYIYLIEGYYKFELMYDNKLYNWKGFKYTGSDSPETFNLVLEDSEGEQVKYENNHLSAYLYDDNESGKRTLKLMYSRDFNVVEPVRKTTVS